MRYRLICQYQLYIIISESRCIRRRSHHYKLCKGIYLRQHAPKTGEQKKINRNTISGVK